MEQEGEEEAGGDWPMPPQPFPPPPPPQSRSSSSKMPFAFSAAADAAAAGVESLSARARQTQSESSGRIARPVRVKVGESSRPSWGAKLLILGLVAASAWRELFSPGRVDLSAGRGRRRAHDDNERLRQLAHCPLADCPRAEISGGPSNRFGPLLVFAAAAATVAPVQSLNTSAGGGGGQVAAQPNNNNNNETTARAAAASDLRAKVAADAHAGDASTRNDQNQQQQQQLKKVDLNFTRAPTPTAGGSDLPLIIATKLQQRQEEQQQQQQQGDLTAGPPARMTSVVCNSRCRCIQLELASEPAADQRAKQNEGAQTGSEQWLGQQRARDKMLVGGGGGLAGWLGAKLGVSSASPPPPPPGLVESGMSLPSDNNNEIASDTNSSAAEARAKSNKIALIEFGQDYSFDELDEFSSSSPSSSSSSAGVEFERGPDESSEQTTSATTSTTAPLSAGTGNGNHHVGLAGATSARPSPQRAPLAGGNSAQPAANPAAIKHANDQSNDVNVNAATAAGANQTGPPTLLSIKYNKTGGAQAQLATLYPHYLNMAAHHHGQHHHSARGQRHKLMPAAAAAAAAFNQQMSAHAFGVGAQSAHDFQGQQREEGEEEEEERMPRVARISPLRSLNLTGHEQLDRRAETIVAQMLRDVEAQSVQSLSLSHNKLQFETWTQLYGLLAVPLRRHIYHLDLSHNSLAKLGVTFTGYIEHHLAHQLIVQHNQTWPFSSPLAQNQSNYLQFKLGTSAARPPSSSESSLDVGLHHQTIMTTRATRVQKQHQKLLSQQQQLRHPNLGEGKLYNAVRSELPLEVSALLVAGQQAAQAHDHEPNATSVGQTPTQPTVHRKSQGARMPQTILHQAARVKALDLSYNKLEWLINDQFRVLKHVESIRLDHNQIRYIHQQAFNGLEELKYLNLNYNRIQTIYMEQFQTNSNLRALFLQSNYLTYLRADSLAALDKLRRLDLSRNKFSLLSNNAFAGLDSLEFLNLSSNQFVHVPSTSFHSLAAASLRALDLSRNQLAQLMPGTFFHLKLERLWLDENAQLVAIDRGAFWDLPYLSELSLRSNQMLVSINSQAFVGLPNIRAINYDECPLLDADTKQMLDNVTRAATLRHLIQVGRPAESEQRAHLASVNGSTNSGNGTETATAAQSAHQHQHEHMRLQMSSDAGLQPPVPADQSSAPHKQLASKSAMKYVYSAGCLVFIVIALKLVFSHTSTGRRLGAGRRRRRRVYQSSASSLSSAGEDSLSSGSAVSAASSAANYCDELPPPPPPPGCMGGFEMCEQQPHGALTSGAGPKLAPPGQDQQAPPLSELVDNLGDRERGVQQGAPACCDFDQLQVVAQSAGCPCPDCCAQAGQQVCVSSPDGIENVGAETGLAPENGEGGHQSATREGNSCCDTTATTTNADDSDETMPTATTGAAAPDETGESQRGDSAAMELIHDQLVAAGYGDYGHAKCAHFYQSLGPALQLADLTASLVNQMDYYS